MSERVEAIGEWARAVADDGRVRLEIGDDFCAPGESTGFVTLKPSKAIEVAIRLVEQAYSTQGVEVERVAIVVNPEFDDEEETLSGATVESTPPEDLPS